MLKHLSLYRFLPIAAPAMLVAGVQIALAEPWGTNAPVCPLGRCAPARQTWGYYPTKWRQWPGAVYPDQEIPTPQPGANQIPPSDIELPNPNKEAEVQTPNPSRSSSGRSGAVGNGGEDARGLGVEPTPAPIPSQNGSGNLLQSPKNAPGALPDDANFGPPNFGNPPSTNTPPATTTPSGSSSRIKPRTLGIGAISGGIDSRSRDSTLLKFSASPSAAESPLLISPDSEPELLVPSLSSRPLSSNADLKTERSPSNPLRDLRADPVLPASLMDVESPGTSLEPTLRRGAVAPTQVEFTKIPCGEIDFWTQSSLAVHPYRWSGIEISIAPKSSGSLRQGRLGRGQARDWHAERGAAYIIKANFMAESD